MITIVINLIEEILGKTFVSRFVIRNARALLPCGCLAMTIFLVASCRRSEQRPRATFAPIAQLEQSFGRLIIVSNVPTPDQHGTGDRVGLFQDDSGTIWGIPLTIDENGRVLGCAPPSLRESPVSDTLPADTVDIVGAANEPSGWRGGTGKLELLLRDTQGQLYWHPVASAKISSGPVCWSQSPPEIPLDYYRLAKTGR
jgi:hypothetical protein